MDLQVDAAHDLEHGRRSAQLLCAPEDKGDAKLPRQHMQTQLSCGLLPYTRRIRMPEPSACASEDKARPRKATCPPTQASASCMPRHVCGIGTETHISWHSMQGFTRRACAHFLHPHFGTLETLGLTIGGLLYRPPEQRKMPWSTGRPLRIATSSPASCPAGVIVIPTFWATPISWFPRHRFAMCVVASFPTGEVVVPAMRAEPIAFLPLLQ